MVSLHWTLVHGGCVRISHDSQVLKNVVLPACTVIAQLAAMLTDRQLAFLGGCGTVPYATVQGYRRFLDRPSIDEQVPGTHNRTDMTHFHFHVLCPACPFLGNSAHLMHLYQYCTKIKHKLSLVTGTRMTHSDGDVGGSGAGHIIFWLQ